MIEKVLMHKNSDVKKVYLKYFLALIPLIIYGFYKNGLLLYLDNRISFFVLFKPLIFPLIGGLAGLLVNYIKKKEIKFSDYALYGLLVGMIIPINTNIIIFSILIFSLLLLCNYLTSKLSFNNVAFIKLVLVLIVLIFNQYNYANAIELSNEYAFNFIDVLFGQTIGGVSSSSIIWILVGFFYLVFDYYYKKEIPLYSFVSYFGVILIFFLINHDLSFAINNFFASSIWFAFIFVAPLFMFSSYTRKGKIYFGALIGLLTGILIIFIGNMEAAYIAIFIVSLIKDILDKKTQKITK